MSARPLLGGFGCLGVAIFLAHSVRDSIEAKGMSKSDRMRFDGWLASAEMIYAKHARGEVREVKMGRELKPTSITKDELKSLLSSLKVKQCLNWARTDLAPALHIAHVSALAALNCECRYGGPYAVAAIRTATKHAVTIRTLDAHAFVLDLDRILLREELRSMLAERREPLAENVKAVLWRAANDGKATHVLGVLENGQHILIFKVGSRWQLFTGTRDDVLATVPEEHMESAVNTVR